MEDLELDVAHAFLKISFLCQIASPLAPFAFESVEHIKSSVTERRRLVNLTMSYVSMS